MSYGSRLPHRSYPLPRRRIETPPASAPARVRDLDISRLSARDASMPSAAVLFRARFLSPKADPESFFWSPDQGSPDLLSQNERQRAEGLLFSGLAGQFPGKDHTSPSRTLTVLASASARPLQTPQSQERYYIATHRPHPYFPSYINPNPHRHSSSLSSSHSTTPLSLFPSLSQAVVAERGLGVSGVGPCFLPRGRRIHYTSIHIGRRSESIPMLPTPRSPVDVPAASPRPTRSRVLCLSPLGIGSWATRRNQSAEIIGNHTHPHIFFSPVSMHYRSAWGIALIGMHTLPSSSLPRLRHCRCSRDAHMLATSCAYRARGGDVGCDRGWRAACVIAVSLDCKYQVAADVSYAS